MKQQSLSFSKILCLTGYLLFIGGCGSEPVDKPQAVITVNSIEQRDKDTIHLSAAGSFSYVDTVSSYSWTLRSDQTDVELEGADTDELIMRVPLSTQTETYIVKLTIKDSSGESGVATLFLDIPPAAVCPTCTDQQLNQMIKGGQLNIDNFSEVAALDNDSIMWGNRESNTLVLYNPDNKTQTDEITLDNTPEQLVYIPDHRSVYWTTNKTQSIGRYQLDDRTLINFPITNEVYKLSAGKHRLYYTTLGDSVFSFPMHSISTDGAQSSHGAILDDLYAYNTVRDEFVSTGGPVGASSGNVHRYSLNENDQIQQIQRSESSLITTGRTIAFSNDGTRVVVSAYSNDNDPNQLLEIAADDVLQINGAWQLIGDRGSQASAFSPDDQYLAVINDLLLKLYDTNSRELIAAYRLPDPSVVSASCGTGPYWEAQLGFTSSGKYVYIANRCEYYPSPFDGSFEEFDPPMRGIIFYRELPF